MIAILDYGAGNLRSVQNTLDAIGAQYTVICDAQRLHEAQKIILPGVGHFGQLMRSLDEMDIRSTLTERIGAGVPFLGICLGLQALFERSSEAGEVAGLGIFPGAIERFPADARVPHMGWNTLDFTRPSRLLKGIAPESHVYFAHSYCAPVCEATAATTTYTRPYTSALEQDNVFGVQFHPEKSGPLGLQIVRNFVEL
ncbi:MAG TPA: imidazole glycerol phosphate synthase subunit HisH [Bryobacteraceae bacterium]|nr:imidazole glycerol phosphate synthase subunit HisH [Bryobacteraceae bacterium]